MKQVNKIIQACLLMLFAAALYAQDRDISDICGDCVVERYATCGGFLEGATFDRSGTLWVVDLISGNILTVSNNGQCTVRANTGGQPNGAKHHRDGRLFIADKMKGIIAFEPDTGDISIVVDSFKAEHLRGVNDLVFDKDGGFYFTEPYGSNALNLTGRVFYLPPGGNNANLELVADTLAFPNGIALTPGDNNLYIGEYGQKRIVQMPSLSSSDIFDSAYVKAYIEGGVGPDGMALDEEGNIYQAVFQGKQIRVIGADGYAYGSIWLPGEAGTFTTNVAFKDDYLYITESSQGVVWRVRVNHRGLPLYHQR